MDNFTGSPTPTVSWMKDVEPISSVQYDPRITINATGSLRIESKKIFLFRILYNPVSMGSVSRSRKQIFRLYSFSLNSQLSIFG